MNANVYCQAIRAAVNKEYQVTRRKLIGGLCGLAAVMGLALVAGPAPLIAAGQSAGFIDVPRVVKVRSGAFIQGSNATEREAAYRLDEAAYAHRVTRQQGWYENEPAPRNVNMGAFFITATPITNDQYAAFVADTGHPAPDVDAATWRLYKLNHAFSATRKYAWKDAKPPPGRGDHPVVLVSYADARAYALWLTKRTKLVWRLPTEAVWEKAARGEDGARFPWGDFFDPDRLNSADRGPFDTVPVGRYPSGASPYGVLDAAGQVFEWTASRSGKNRYVVKGGSWDDRGCGVCRPAARHGRPGDLKHILIGFRLVRE